ncbi:MAG: hypothetical protein JSS32_04560 [Verrucomicrobia bacterium]|nr:hypothetical protein [Verrucomicrobiota bacterium]
MRWVCAFAIAASGLFGQNKIELVATWLNDPNYYASVFKAHHIDATVIPSDFSSYKEALRYEPTRIGRWLRKIGLDFPPTVPLKEGVSKIVFFDLPDDHHVHFDLRRLPKDKLILFHWEPPNVIRKMYRPEVMKLFSRVYTWNDDLVDNIRFFKLYYPVLKPMIEEVVPFEEKKLCVLVATYIKNPSKTSLYKERCNAARFFEYVGEEGFSLYGKQWNSEEYPSYRGPIDDKIETIKNYRFSICYENSKGLRGYVTEKIFDCFAAGNVPIYWGAENITDYVPADCFIDRRKFSSMAELYDFIKSMGEEEYEGYLSRIRAYLKSDKAQMFSMKRFEKLFCEAVSK